MDIEILLISFFVVVVVAMNYVAPNFPVHDFLGIYEWLQKNKKSVWYTSSDSSGCLWGGGEDMGRIVVGVALALYVMLHKTFQEKNVFTYSLCN